MIKTQTPFMQEPVLARRALLQAGAAITALVGCGSVATAQAPAKPAGGAAGKSKRRKFHLKYAPHFGQFESHAGKDLIDQLKYMADQGFTAVEDNGLLGRPV